MYHKRVRVFRWTLGACCRAVRYGWVYIKNFDREKTLALRVNNDNFDKIMVLSNNIREDLV